MLLVVKAIYMLGVCLAGAWRAVGRRSALEGVCERGQVSILLKLVYIVWFLVRKVDPYYGKYKEILAKLIVVISLSDSSNQLIKRAYAEFDRSDLSDSRDQLKPRTC